MPFTETSDQTYCASPKLISSEMSFWVFAILAVCVVLCVTPAMAADSSSLSSAKASYQKDRALCNSGQSNQDRVTCLREAGAAYTEARRGQLNDGSAQYQQNAMARCSALPSQDQPACQRRVMGEGVADGSVEQGGIYRRIETPDTAPNDSTNGQTGY